MFFAREAAMIVLTERGDIMSYAICRVAKIKASGVTGIQIHDRREKAVSHTNADIDFTRSDENVELARGGRGGNQSFHQIIKNRLDELGIKPRKNANVMAQMLITSDTEFFEQMKDYQERKKFFEDALEFVKEKYGEKNLVSATVHFDEKTPHMHVNFVPITNDGRLSARDLFNPRSLRELQDEFHQYITSKGYDLARGQRDSKAKHLEMRDLKLKTREEQVLKKEQLLQSKYNDIDAQIKEYHRQIELLKSRKQELIEEVKKMRGAFMTDYSLPKGKKSLLGDKVTFSAEEADNLIKSAKAMMLQRVFNCEMEAQLNQAERGERETMSLTTYDKNSELMQQIEVQNQKIVDLNFKIRKLTDGNDRLNRELNKINKVLDENPELAAAFSREFNLLKKTMKIDRTLER